MNYLSLGGSPIGKQNSSIFAPLKITLKFNHYFPTCVPEQL